MKANYSLNSYAGYVFCKNYDGADGVKWYGCGIYGDSAGVDAGKVRCYIDDGTNTPQPMTSGTYNDSTWHNIVFVRNTTSSRLLIYVDGNPTPAANNTDTAGSISNMTVSTRNNFYIGSRADLGAGGNARWFNGTIDELRIWNRSLNITEIQAEMQSSLPVIRPTSTWSFEETGQYVNDTHIWVNGTYGSALSFDGINDKVSITDSNSFSISNELTVSAWVYPLTNQSTGGSNQIVDRLSWPNSQGFFLREGYNQSHVPNFYVGNGTCGVPCWQSVSAGSIDPDAWYYITGTVKANDKIRIYINGFLKQEKNYLGIINQSTGSLFIGWEGATKAFNGTIDEVRIWNRVLNSTEILDEMNKG